MAGIMLPDLVAVEYCFDACARDWMEAFWDVRC